MGAVCEGISLRRERERVWSSCFKVTNLNVQNIIEVSLPF